MAVTMADISKLRAMTGAGLMDCKKALAEANNDMNAAIEIIRKKGQAVAAKREKLQITRQRAKLEKTLGSIADLNRLPSALFVVDVMKEHIAVAEANRLGIPVFGIVDTNSDPNPIDFVIPANDDASKSIELILDTLCAAMIEGLEERKVEKVDNKDAEAEEAPKPKRTRVARRKGAEAEAEAPAEEAATEEAAE